MHTPDLVSENIDKLLELFPSCMTEMRRDGQVKQAIDFDRLRQELSTSIIDGQDERYQLNWPGKREALITANKPIAKTLRPYRDESVYFDTTKNLFVEGDNLEALKLLQETYLNKIKVIYIDPPYNTGNDFIYKDNFSQDIESYLLKSNQKDENSNRLVTNSESNGRFHSDWLSMMYPRLKFARNLLKDDGIIFISIDDHEFDNLKKICNEIFGEENFVGNIVRATGQTTGQDGGGLGSSFDYILAYTKIPDLSLTGLPLTPHDLKRFENEDERGKYAYDQLRKTGSNDQRVDRPNMFYPIKNPDGEDLYPTGPGGYESCWRVERKKYEELVNDNYILWKKTEKDGKKIWWPYIKYYLEGRTKRPSPLWDDLDGNKKATRDLRNLFDGKKIFDHPKPLAVIKRLIQIAPNSTSNDLILDFFAGSGTTAHAVMELNAEDNGTRRFIMVQVPEICDEQSEAFKAGYKTIAEICKERIRRAGNKIKSENINKKIDNLDIGFRVLRIDKSNMKDIYYEPDILEQSNLISHINNIREDRNSEDLLFQILLDWGIDLSLPIYRKNFSGKILFFIDHNQLVACFDEKINEEFVKKLAAYKPLRVVFRDSSFDSDSVKINIEQIFKHVSPGTEIKTI